MRRIIFEVIVIAFLSVLLALGNSLLRRDALSWVARRQPVEEKRPEDASFKHISLAQAKEMHARHAAVFIDARSRRAYEEGHIAGAMNLEPNLFDQWSRQLVDELQTVQVIVTYCDGAQCPLSRELAEKLTWLGYEKVYDLKDGWAQWRAAGLPIETGDE